MKLTSAVIALVTSAASSAYSPRTSTTSQITVPVASQQSNIAGAVYFLTNEPDGNFVVSSNIGFDGELTFKGAVSAGGRGSHGLPDLNAIDALFSQGSIMVSKSNLFAVNAGSNTIAMFSIDANEPGKLIMVGNPAPTGGEFPVSVAISKQSGQVCVLNGGKVNGVNCFGQDPKLGLTQRDNTLRPLNINQTTPPTGPAGAVSNIQFSEDGSELIASVKGTSPMQGFLAVWDVDAKTGALSKDFTRVTLPANSEQPYGMSIIPGKNALLVTDPNVGFEIVNFESGKNATSTAFPVDGQQAICWSTFSPKTGNFYVVDAVTFIVTEVHIDSHLKAAVVNQYPQGNGSSPIDSNIGTIGDDDFLYIMASGVTSVMVMALNAPSEAIPVQQFNFKDEAEKAGIKIDSSNLQGMTVFVKGV